MNRKHHNSTRAYRGENRACTNVVWTTPMQLKLRATLIRFYALHVVRSVGRFCTKCTEDIKPLTGTLCPKHSQKSKPVPRPSTPTSVRLIILTARNQMDLGLSATSHIGEEATEVASRMQHQSLQAFIQAPEGLSRLHRSCITREGQGGA